MRRNLMQGARQAVQTARRVFVPALWPAAIIGLAAGCGATPLPDGLYAEFYTTRGTITARLEPELTPLAVANFVGLAEGTIQNAAFDPGRPYYDGTLFHRVVPGPVIQAGSPRSERTTGPGYVFPNQIHASLSHDHAGALGVANAGPHTNGSQFYITLADRSYLDGDYIVFGDVVSGMDVVTRIREGDVIDSVRIVRKGSAAQGFHPTTASFQAMAREESERVLRHIQRKLSAEREWIEGRWPDASGPADGVRTVLLSDAVVGAASDAASGAGSSNGPLRVRYTGKELHYAAYMRGYEGPDLQITEFGSGERGLPGFHDPAESFLFVPGRTTINPGLDKVIAGMRPGEERVVIVPAAYAYGGSGFYAPTAPGEPRFVISPNTMLVYEVEVLAGG